MDHKDSLSPTFDWISALAAQEASRTTATDGPHALRLLSKEERIERRLNKKQKRLVLIQAKRESRNKNPVLYETEEKKRQSLNRYSSKSNNHRTFRGFETTTTNRSGLLTPSASEASTTSACARQIHRERLKRIASQFRLALQSMLASPSFSSSSSETPEGGGRRNLQLLSSAVQLQSPFKKRRWEEALVQPAKHDYGGIGLARPSLFLSFDDPSLLPRLEEAFGEHVPGFFGRPSFQKSAKKQSGRCMLWRTLLSEREKQRLSLSSSSREGESSTTPATNAYRDSVRLNWKKLSEMRPDERVEAMIRAGMI
jgi:hypothetical protein